MTSQPEILIVEDERVVTEAVGRALAASGLQSAVATNVAEATRRLDEHPYKVLLTDIRLPQVSGFELLEIASRRSPAPLVVMITGYVTIDTALESFSLGAFDFLPKPFDVPELLGVVNRALRYYDLGTRPETASLRRGAPQPCYFLGRHSWARLEADGSATLAVASTFPGLIGELTSIEFPQAGEGTHQGQCCCVMRSTDQLVYRVWAPLSGRLIATNPRVTAEPDLINRDPYDSGWLSRILPADLDKELSNLTRR